MLENGYQRLRLFSPRSSLFNPEHNTYLTIYGLSYKLSKALISPSFQIHTFSCNARNLALASKSLREIITRRCGFCPSFFDSVKKVFTSPSRSVSSLRIINQVPSGEKALMASKLPCASLLSFMEIISRNNGNLYFRPLRWNDSLSKQCNSSTILAGKSFCDTT